MLKTCEFEQNHANDSAKHAFFHIGYSLGGTVWSGTRLVLCCALLTSGLPIWPFAFSHAQEASPQKSSDGLTIAQQASLQAGDWWGAPVIHVGVPAVQIGQEAPGSSIVFITLVKYGEEPAFRFPFIHMHAAGSCEGYFYITPTRLVYAPVGHDQDALNLRRSDSPAVSAGRYGTASFLIVYGRNMDFFPKWDRTAPVLTWKEFRDKDADKSHYKLYERQAGEQSEHDSQVFRAWWWKAYQNFGAAEEQFNQLTANAFLPLSAEQQLEQTSEERAGDSAVQAGQLGQALQHYLAALQKLPEQWAPPEVLQKLREQIIQVVVRMNPRPVVPEDGNRHFAYALAAIEEGKKSGDVSKLDDAINELNQALRIAPWWPQAYFNLGLVLEMRERYADAARNLRLYLLVAPNAPNAAEVQQKIYQLDYKAGTR